MSPDQAPEGVELRFLPRPTGTAWATWRAANPVGDYWINRKIIRPRLILIHTNGAKGEGSRQSAYNWSMAAPDNTKCHYQVDRDGSATKFLPSDRQGIANYKADPFGLSIETADEGWPVPGPASGFTPAQAETIARIVAYETELWDIPIETPATWNGEGVGAHTDPFGYPHWTKYDGKPCPGTQKKYEIRELIMPRAREIREGDDDMAATARLVKHPAYQNIWLVGAGPALALSGELYASYKGTVEMIVSAHPQLLESMLIQSGLQLSDLVPV